MANNILGYVRLFQELDLVGCQLLPAQVTSFLKSKQRVQANNWYRTLAAKPGERDVAHFSIFLGGQFLYPTDDLLVFLGKAVAGW